MTTSPTPLPWPSNIPWPSHVPNYVPHDKNVVFTDKCYRHFNKGCPPGKDNQGVLNCGTCVGQNFSKWYTGLDITNPSSADKQKMIDCGGRENEATITPNDLISTGMYCAGAHDELDSNTSWWVWLIIGLVILIVLGFLINMLRDGKVGSRGGMNNQGWYGGFAEEPMREM
jgi:hypothetical protein